MEMGGGGGSDSAKMGGNWKKMDWMKRITRCGVPYIITMAAMAALAVVLICLGDSGNVDLTLYVQDVYVPSLVPSGNTTTTAAFNTSVFVDVKFQRKKTTLILRPHFYAEADFQMTVFYGQSESRNFPVGSHMVEGFTMGHKKRTVHVMATVEAIAMPWQEALHATTAGNVVTMVIELRWPRHIQTADVSVDHSGHMISVKPIQLRCRSLVEHPHYC